MQQHGWARGLSAAATPSAPAGGLDRLDARRRRIPHRTDVNVASRSRMRLRVALTRATDYTRDRDIPMYAFELRGLRPINPGRPGCLWRTPRGCAVVPRDRQVGCRP